MTPVVSPLVARWDRRSAKSRDGWSRKTTANTSSRSQRFTSSEGGIRFGAAKPFTSSRNSCHRSQCVGFQKHVQPSWRQLGLERLRLLRLDRFSVSEIRILESSLVTHRNRNDVRGPDGRLASTTSREYH